MACPVSTLDRLVTIASYATRKPPDSAVGLRIRGLQDNAIQQSRSSEGAPNGSYGRRGDRRRGHDAQLIREWW